MPVIVIPAIIAGIATVFSGVINIFMSLPQSLKLLVFYAVFLGLGISIPGTDISIGHTFLSPLFLALFGFLNIPMTYELMVGVIGAILFLYYVHFFVTMGKTK